MFFCVLLWKGDNGTRQAKCWSLNFIWHTMKMRQLCASWFRSRDVTSHYYHLLSGCQHLSIFTAPSMLEQNISGTPQPSEEEWSFVFWELIPLNHFLFPLEWGFLNAFLCVLFCFNGGRFQVSLKGQVCFSPCLPFIWWVASAPPAPFPQALRLISSLTSVLFFEVDSGYFIMSLFRKKKKRVPKYLWIYIPSCYLSLLHPNIWVNKKCICIFQPFLCTVTQWKTPDAKRNFSTCSSGQLSALL